MCIRDSSGNIHVQIVINSLRIYEVTLLPYMDRPADTREGCKQRCTNATMEYYKSEVMEMCQREGLYQIDLLNGSKERITEREYWAAKKGQLALDKENAAREATGQPVSYTHLQLKAIYKDNADTIIGNMDSRIFLGGSEPTTLKELNQDGRRG